MIYATYAQPHAKTATKLLSKAAFPKRAKRIRSNAAETLKKSLAAKFGIPKILPGDWYL